MEGSRLIPDLPNDVSLQILARVPREYYSQAMPRVSSSWRQTVTSPDLFALRKRLQVTESWLYTAVVCEHENRPAVLWFASTTQGSRWWPLPLMAEEHRPIYGFRCATVGENLYVLGGCEWQKDCTNIPATNKVSVFNARTNRWSCVQGMSDARANFACGVLHGNLLVAGGDRFFDAGDGNYDDDDEKEDYGDCNCLKSAEKYNPVTNAWTPLSDMIYAKHFVGGCVTNDKFFVCGFVCEGDLQFCEITEIYESAEERWVEFHGDGGEEEYNPPQLKSYYCDIDNAVRCCELKQGMYGSNKECECGSIPRASIVIAI